MASDAPAFDAPVLLTQAHDSSTFDSSEPALDDWLRQRAWPNLLAGASRTYVICPPGTNGIVGYFALSWGRFWRRRRWGRCVATCRRKSPA